jgi:hypothetical protein
VTTRDRKGGSRQDPDADQLAAAWNEITAGRRPSRDGDHADLTAPVELLHAAVPDVPPRPAFMQDLREQLMQATLPVDAPISEPVRHLSANPMVVQSRTSMAAHVPKSLRKAAARWLPIAATITLLMATAAGAYFSIDRPNNEPNGTNIAAPSAGTSESSGSTFLEECDVIGAYFPCVADPWVTEGLIVRANLSGEDLAVSNVQMQGWELDRLGHITFGEPANPVTGVGVDIVTSGAYLAAAESSNTRGKVQPSSLAVAIRLHTQSAQNLKSTIPSKAPGSISRQF